ncbi:snaclec purpureotin subunit beta-like [Sceloporus undulatus]|uniref:snaclec purpureotin subunit beta-like n=1 Tax=Sceloporus undulatus TaxID=8520 RepID=UPI001C4CF16B|nr:snaclec purpureotin subunit beta-like [Sceloporus undulatus]
MELETCLRFSLFGFLISSFFLQGVKMGTVNIFLLSFSVTIFYLQGTVAVDCPKQWKHYNDFCYGVIQEDVTWAEAEIYCQEKGHNAHLTSIHDRTEVDIISKLIKSDYADVKEVWVGLQDPRGTNRWRWTDSNPFNYKFWSAKAAKGKGQCAYLSRESGFEKLEKSCCQRNKFYLCKSVL